MIDASAVENCAVEPFETAPASAMQMSARLKEKLPLTGRIFAAFSVNGSIDISAILLDRAIVIYIAERAELTATASEDGPLSVAHF